MRQIPYASAFERILAIYFSGSLNSCQYITLQTQDNKLTHEIKQAPIIM